MPRHRIRDIALQSGLSEVTVDRVLNGRGNVRSTIVDAVNDAIADLDRQQARTQVYGRRFTIEVIVQGPSSDSRPLVDAQGGADLESRQRRAGFEATLTELRDRTGVAIATGLDREDAALARLPSGGDLKLGGLYVPDVAGVCGLSRFQARHGTQIVLAHQKPVDRGPAPTGRNHLRQ